MNNSEMIETAQSRLQVYTILAEVFLQLPTQKNIKTHSVVIREILDEAHYGEEIPQFGTIESIKQEYYDLFFVPMSGHYVPPYESALLDYNTAKKKPFGHLFSSAARHVQACYEDVGFKPQELNIFEPLRNVTFPDHIGYELAFMGLLCLAEKSALEKDEEKGNIEAKGWKEFQYNFINEHLAKWIPNFAIAIQKSSKGYYSEAAKATKEWINEDLEYLNSQPFRREEMA